MIDGAIYLRVSKDDGTQTVENQRPDVARMAEARGYIVLPAHVYVDEASGAKGREARPGLDRMLMAAARGEFRAVFIWALDRLSRDDSYMGGAAMIGDLDRFNVAILSHQETWLDTSGPFRGVLVSFALLIAADFRRRLIARTNAGIARARAAGVHLGRPLAAASNALLARAADLRRGPPGSKRPRHSWRTVVRLLEAEKFAYVPSHATLARLCTKAYPDLPTLEPGWRAAKSF